MCVLEPYAARRAIPSMIAFVETKRPDYGQIQKLLAGSEASGVWSNFGPLSRRFEEAVAEALTLPPGRRVIACASGTVALHGLVQLYEHVSGRPLRWVVSAFTFYAQRQGPLAAARVVDCDPGGFLDVDELMGLPTDLYDGVVVTNLFGTALHTERYEELAARNGKILLLDSGTCFGSAHHGKPFGDLGAGEIFSFHHTKPCGFGEGGCAVVPVELEDTFRSLINFGIYKGIDTGARSSNGKMSDVAAAFILDRLRHLEDIRAAHRRQFRRVAGIARALGLGVLVDGGQEGAFPNLVPILFPRPVGIERLPNALLVAHKYYRPVAAKPRADAIYARVVCLPCHRDVAQIPDEELRATLADWMR
jgi:dTDP-4-amino-4,6-dideoxygalactose transaminase